MVTGGAIVLAEYFLQNRRDIHSLIDPSSGARCWEGVLWCPFGTDLSKHARLTENLQPLSPEDKLNLPRVVSLGRWQLATLRDACLDLHKCEVTSEEKRQYEEALCPVGMLIIIIIISRNSSKG